MKAMIFAAGLGTRLRPLTDNMPKALVRVGDVPMLERVICHLKECGYDRIVVNVHHYADMIIGFLREATSATGCLTQAVQLSRQENGFMIMNLFLFTMPIS